MSEIIGGVIVVVAFIGFVLWKNRGKPKQQMTTADWYKEEWWALHEGQDVTTTRAGSTDDRERERDDDD